MEPTDTAPQGIEQATNQDIDMASTQSAEESKQQAVGNFNFDARGASGTRLFGEIFDEEYLNKLSGTRRADIFDEMIRSDDTITMLLTARKNPILKATWTVEPAKGDNPEQEESYRKQAEHVQHEFFDRMHQDFFEVLEEALTFVEHGYALFERVHELVDDPRFGKYVGYKKLGWRSQRTIDRWNLHKDGRIATVFQQADGDVGAYAHIPGDWTTIFSLRKTGDNYEGVSALRPIYGNWQRKNMFLKLIAIGIERYAVNTPVGKIPAGKESSTAERDKFIGMLKAISSHHQNYFALPAGWEVDFLKNPFDADKVVAVIKREDEGMVRSFMANHLNLGQGGGSGSYALGTDLSDQFLSIIENDAAIIARRFNKEIIREFINLNYGKQSKYPKISVSGINDKFSKEFAEILKMLVDGKLLKPTENLEVWLRKRLNTPDLLETDKAVPTVVADAGAPQPGAPQEEAVQSQALNGAQVSSLLQIIGQVATNNLPRDSAKEIIVAAFPFITSDQVEQMIGLIGKGFQPANPQAMTQALNDIVRGTKLADHEHGVTFADMKKTKAKVKEQLDSSAEAVMFAMRDELQARADDYIAKIVSAMRKEKRENWRKVIRNSGDLAQEGDFNKKLKRAMIETAGRALNQARNEIPGGRKIEFMEGFKSRIKLDEVDDLFSQLPKRIRELILTDPTIAAGAQFGTLRSKILLVASGAVDETADPDVIEKKLKDEVNKALTGAAVESEISGAIATAATNLTTKVYNSTRIEFFQTDEALEKIEAFQFVNNDPVSPICQDLNGRIFRKDDPESDLYLPPLHHNCKSFIVPIFDLQGKQVSDIGLKPSKAGLDKFKTL
jgi:SPP1 gp7 family putative phage head morphogenesis protein